MIWDGFNDLYGEPAEAFCAAGLLPPLMSDPRLKLRPSAPSPM